MRVKGGREEPPRVVGGRVFSVEMEVICLESEGGLGPDLESESCAGITPKSCRKLWKVCLGKGFVSILVQEYGILPHSRTYYCLLFSLYHMFIIFVISY